MYTILDFETTGLDYREEQVIEIGAVKLDKYLKPVSQINVLVKLDEGRVLKEFITNLTGITAEDLESSSLDEFTALSMLEAFIGDDIVVAQFASFDLSYLSKVMTPERFICTRSVSRILDNDKKAGLKDLVPRYGATLDNHHRAIADVEATVEVFKGMMGRLLLEGYHMEEVLNVMVDSKERPLSYVPTNTKKITLGVN
jgi:DNA polymerase III subunit epsilon